VSGIYSIIPANAKSGQIILNYFLRRSGVSAERRSCHGKHFQIQPGFTNFIRNFLALP
jgi:hypothetical protein